jgi:hypothetical protein
MSTPSECLLFSVLTTLAIFVLIHVVVRMIINSDKTCSRPSKRLKIPADCPKTGHDFIVALECPDGTLARIAIPIDADSYEGRGSRVCDEDTRPVGLNLVCPGHYT